MSVILTEWEKMEAGLEYHSYEPEFLTKFLETIDKTMAICDEINRNGMSKSYYQSEEKLARLIEMKGGNYIRLPFICTLGKIELGEGSVINFNAYFQDVAKVTFGKRVLVGPNCSFYTATHSLKVTARNEGMMAAKEIVVKDNVWLAGSVMVCPGVTIGENSVIGTGSVVTKDIPANVFAGGNPCKVIKGLEE